MDAGSKRYVVWDGAVERPYVDNPKVHDCMVCADFKLLSVQSLRQYAIKSGVEPILIFACEAGKAAYEDDFEGRGGGVFSHFFMKVLKYKPYITMRELIHGINHEIRDAGYDQKCEVICLKEFLDAPGLLPILNQPTEGETRESAGIVGPHPRLDGDANRVYSHSNSKALLLIDMCRIPSEYTGHKPDIGMFDEKTIPGA